MTTEHFIVCWEPVALLLNPGKGDGVTVVEPRCSWCWCSVSPQLYSCGWEVFTSCAQPCITDRPWIVAASLGGEDSEKEEGKKKEIGYNIKKKKKKENERKRLSYNCSPWQQSLSCQMPPQLIRMKVLNVVRWLWAQLLMTAKRKCKMFLTSNWFARAATEWGWWSRQTSCELATTCVVCKLSLHAKWIITTIEMGLAWAPWSILSAAKEEIQSCFRGIKDSPSFLVKLLLSCFVFFFKVFLLSFIIFFLLSQSEVLLFRFLKLSGEVLGVLV